MNLKEHSKRLKTDIPALLLCLKNPETPVSAKVLASITVAYALSPIDLIPDFVPVLGYLDDLLLLPVLAAWTIRLIPPETFERCRVEAADLWPDGRPRRWYYALPIVFFWALLLWLIIRAFFK